MCILQYTQNRLEPKCFPSSCFCLSQRQLHENLFMALTTFPPNATVPQGRACLLLLAVNCWGSVLHHTVQTRQAGRASASQLQQRTCPIMTCSQKVPMGGSHSIAMGCWGSSALQHGVPGMPRQHCSPTFSCHLTVLQQFSHCPKWF